jgi:DNA polymerase V
MPPTDHTPALISKGLELLSKIYRQGFEYKKTGVMVTELIPEDSVQGSLFDEGSEDQQKHLQSVVDQLNQKLGQNTVRYASMGMRQTWKMRQERKSKCYTTKWDELLVVGAS